MSERRFACTPGGAILRGQKRLRLLLIGLTLTMIAAALIFWLGLLLGTIQGVSWWPGLFALLGAGLPWMAWRMSGDLDLLGLELEGGWMAIQMRRRRERFAIAGATARRLTAEEIAHLERLATNGGVTAGTGGFESHRLGELDLYASDLANAVLVDLGETRLIVTPDAPAAFLEPFHPPDIQSPAHGYLRLDHGSARPPQWPSLHGERRSGDHEPEHHRQERRQEDPARRQG
ncbi:MAG TPA: hypothetical protein VGX68_28795 [Thermoanaerobaculia bacterium]|jgi:hypothetical protein|nr:hypothetical protein [Thermoanaerobaculia bacterium]